jgi:hypothetical protein
MGLITVQNSNHIVSAILEEASLKTGSEPVLAE